MKYTIKNLGGGEAELRIYDEIGFFGTNADEFTRELDGLAATHITVRINSPGGDVFDAIAIKNGLRAHPARVTTVVEGLAASAASVVAIAAADEVVMAADSQLMIHEPWTWTDGNAAELSKTVEQLDKVGAQLARIYAAKAGGTPEQWREAMQKETWFTDEEAVNAGLADRVGVGDSAPAEPVLAGVPKKIMARYRYQGRKDAPAPDVGGGIRRKDNVMPILDQIAARLGVAAGAGEDIVLAALDEVLAEQANEVELSENVETPGSEAEEAELVAAETKEPEATEDNAAADDDADASDTTAAEDSGAPEDDAEVVKISRAVLEDLQQRAARGDEADKERAVARAKALIENDGVKAGRLMGWQVDRWVENAIADYDATRKELLSLASGTVNLAEHGRGGSARDDADRGSDEMTRWSRENGFLAPPTF